MAEINLKACPFCGAISDLQILNQGDVVNLSCHYNCPEEKKEIAPLAHTWFVNCPTCGACGPIFYPVEEEWLGLKTDEDCKEKAIAAWNKRGGDND